MVLPDDFQQWLREAFIATGFPAAKVRHLALLQLAAWRRGEPHKAMPGYATPPPDAPYKTHPHGWGIGNFQRLSSQGRASRKAVQLATSRR